MPSRSLYNFRVLLAFCDEIGFHLAEDFYWFNPAKLPSPIEWVNKRKFGQRIQLTLCGGLVKPPFRKPTFEKCWLRIPIDEEVDRGPGELLYAKKTPVWP